jgi:hypothetical protein
VAREQSFDGPQGIVRTLSVARISSVAGALGAASVQPFDPRIVRAIDLVGCKLHMLTFCQKLFLACNRGGTDFGEFRFGSQGCSVTLKA